MKAFRMWIPVGITIAGLSLLLFITAQQAYRSSLNDPQIQMVEDGVAALTHGASPVEVVPRNRFVDIGSSLAPFIAVYDEQTMPLESSGVLNGAPPKPPAGVFQYAREHGDNQITWQPEAGVRIALVLAHVPSGGFVAAGRNMRLIEDRIATMQTLIGLGMLALLIASYIATLAYIGIRRSSNP